MAEKRKLFEDVGEAQAMRPVAQAGGIDRGRGTPWHPYLAVHPIRIGLCDDRRGRSDPIDRQRPEHHRMEALYRSHAADERGGLAVGIRQIPRD